MSSSLLVQIETAIASAFTRRIARLPESGQLPYTLVLGELRRIHDEQRAFQVEVRQTLGAIMSALDDLKAALAALIAEAVTDLESVIAKMGTPGTSDADLAALTQQANDATAKLKQDVANMTQQPVTTSTGTTTPTP